MKKIISTIIIALGFISICFAQVNDTIYKAYYGILSEDIRYSSVIRVEEPSISDYEGSYHFGESEGESQLEILYSNEKLFAREEYSSWKNDTWELVSVRANPSYNEGVLSVDGIDYHLYIYGTEKGLGSSYIDVKEKVYHYLQFNSHRSIEKPVGTYPETSFVKLALKDLQSYSKSELKIMRNEIFARHGYSFKQGGKMDTYFSKQNWYTSLEKTSNPNVSDIEKHNIDLILLIEKK